MRDQETGGIQSSFSSGLGDMEALKGHRVFWNNQSMLPLKSGGICNLGDMVHLP